MCDDVIIHKNGDEIRCENQGDLMREMPNGLWFMPPITPAKASLDHGFLLTLSPGKQAWVPPIEADDITELEEHYGYFAERCLCPVDLERTAKENGYTYSKNDPTGEFDPFDTHFYDRLIDTGKWFKSEKAAQTWLKKWPRDWFVIKKDENKNKWYIFIYHSKHGDYILYQRGSSQMAEYREAASRRYW